LRFQVDKNNKKIAKKRVSQITEYRKKYPDKSGDIRDQVSIETINKQ